MKRLGSFILLAVIAVALGYMAFQFWESTEVGKESPAEVAAEAPQAPEPDTTVEPADSTETPEAVEPTATSALGRVNIPDGAPLEYTIVSTESDTMRAMDRPLSSYSSSEITELPFYNRVNIVAALLEERAEDRIEATLYEITENAIEKDASIDRLFVFLYGSPETAEAGGAFNVGRALWAPEGKTSGMTEQIARTGNRSTYEIAYTITEAPAGETPEILHGLTIDQRRSYYLELGESEVRAFEVADAQIDPMVDYWGNLDLYDELADRYAAELRAKYGITPEQSTDIIIEAIEGRW